jgi:hypothetical protein
MGETDDWWRKTAAETVRLTGIKACSQVLDITEVGTIAEFVWAVEK